MKLLPRRSDAEHFTRCIRRYKVKVNYKPMNEADRLARIEEVSAVVAKSLRRLSPREWLSL